MGTRLFLLTLLCSLTLALSGEAKEYLVKFHSDSAAAQASFVRKNGGSLSLVTRESGFYLWKSDSDRAVSLAADANVVEFQENRPIRLPENPSLAAQLPALRQFIENHSVTDAPAYPDNPDFMAPPVQSAGSDPLLKTAWGIPKIGADKAWDKMSQGKDIVVAVTDTGVDYNHPDLIANMWRNKGEIAGDNIDNDNNGYVDDIVGWDFATNDNKPYDLSLSLIDILFSGGNPGHGTHVAGVIGAKLNNSIGTAGVAPQVKIMALRFLTEKGQGDTAGAVKAIDYAVANGAQIINASWGSEGEEDGDVILREALQRAEKKGVLFVAAAGNGRLNQTTQKAEGVDNDKDAKPSFPATYPYENIISVAAMNSDDKIAEFSNFGAKTVDIGAPGVKILSTVPGGKYQDTVVDFGGLKVTWDGTSMASPFVSGALAVIWSQNRSWSAQEVKNHLLTHTVAVGDLKGKTVTEGRADLQ